MKKSKKMKYILNTKRLKIIGIILAILILSSISYWYFYVIEVYDENNLPTRLISLEFISNRTEARLYYPGSKEFLVFGESSERAGYANSGVVLTSKDSPEQIYSWYREWLTNHGWQYNEKAFYGLLDTQTSLQGYTRGDREKLYVAMNNPRNLSLALGRDVPDGVTVFEIRYFINPVPIDK